MQSEILEPLVLIVEDSEDDAFFLERSLNRSGVRCRRHYLKDGGEAVAFLQGQDGDRPGQSPVVVFLDLKMPVLNGFDVLRWVQENGCSGKWDIIVLSGSDQQADIEAARRLGASGYLVKPARLEELKDCLLPRIQRWTERLSAVSNNGAHAGALPV